MPKTSIMRFNLVFLAVAGCWRPFSWTSLAKRMLYNVYSIIVASLLCSFTFAQFMEVVLNVNNPEDFTNIMYTMMTMLASCYKIFSLWANHESIAELIQNLTKGTFKPLVPAEREIRRKFDKTIETIAKVFIILVEINCAGNILISLLTNFRKRQLQFKEWIPYDYSSYTIFCLTYIHQYLGIITCILINISCDSLIVAFLLHLCCQITILKYRLQNITNNRDTLRDCIRHHYHIIEYARMVNARFTRIIFFQFVVSTFVVCSNLFQLTKTTLSVYHISLIAYTYCILMQILIYCWFGNKLKLMSLEVVDCIFEMDWITLDNSIKKSLLIVMKRATIPIEFTSAYILNMNLDSFVALLKISYSAYNLLVQIQE